MIEGGRGWKACSEILSEDYLPDIAPTELLGIILNRSVVMMNFFRTFELLKHKFLRSSGAVER